MRGAGRQTLSYLGNLGSSLPAALGQHRGSFYWKRSSGAEDELYVGVRDASDAMQLRRVLTETYADTLYHPANVGTVRQIVPNPNATTWQTVLLGSPTATADTTANADAAAGAAIQLNTTAVSGNVASLVAGAGGNPRGDWGWDLAGWIGRPSGQLSSFRIWFGLFASTPSGSSNPSGISGAGIVYATDLGANLRAWSNDGTTTGTTTNTGIANTEGVLQQWRIASDGTNVTFYVDDVLAATHTSEHPDASTYHTVGVYCTTTTNAARGVQIGRIALVHER